MYVRTNVCSEKKDIKCSSVLLLRLVRDLRYNGGIIEIIKVLLKQYWEYNIPCALWYILDVAAQNLVETCWENRSHYVQLKYQVAKMHGHGCQWFHI